MARFSSAVLQKGGSLFAPLPSAGLRTAWPRQWPQRRAQVRAEPSAPTANLYTCREVRARVSAATFLGWCGATIRELAPVGSNISVHPQTRSGTYLMRCLPRRTRLAKPARCPAALPSHCTGVSDACTPGALGWSPLIVGPISRILYSGVWMLFSASVLVNLTNSSLGSPVVTCHDKVAASCLLRLLALTSATPKHAALGRLG